jgi:hypothetical protein
LNDIAILASATHYGLDGADRDFEKRLASSAPQERPGDPDQRSKAIVDRLDKLRGRTGPNGLCGDPIARAEDVLKTAFSLDVRDGNGRPIRTHQAAAYMREQMRTIAQFEGALWRPAGRTEPESRWEIGGLRAGRGGPADPLGAAESLSEPILSPDLPSPICLQIPPVPALLVPDSVKYRRAMHCALRRGGGGPPL